MGFTPPLRTRLIVLFATIAMAAALPTGACAALLYQEDFSYPAGIALTLAGGGWTAHSGGNPQTVRVGSLAYFCYAGSDVGNALVLGSSGEDLNHAVPGITGGTAYLAALVYVFDAQANGDYFLHFADGPIANNAFRARLFVKKDPGSSNYAFGIQTGSTFGPVYTPFAYVPVTHHLVVVKYTYNSGANDDIVSLIIDPDPRLAEPVPNVSHSSATQADATNLDFVCLRQGATLAAPLVLVDGIRVADTWADAVPWVSPFTVTSTAGPGGTIAPLGPTLVPCLGSVSYAITPDSCFYIADVKVDGVSVGRVASHTLVNVQANRAIVATFATGYTITASAGTGGTISPGAVFACGSDQTFTITPSACRRILDVKVDGVSVGAVSSYTFTNVQANHTIAATFAVIQYVITSTPGPGGTIHPIGPQPVTCGSNLAFQVLPHPAGSVLLDVLVDGISLGPLATYTFTNVQADHTIEAVFDGDSAPPRVRMVQPNGGENLFVGDPTTIVWTADDNFLVTSIDLYVSRFGDTGPWEPIASGLANTGAYSWPGVTSPGTNTDVNPNYVAYFRVVAHDDAGFSATDDSDTGVSLYDLATETLVSRFEAQPLVEGVELRWQLTHPELFAAQRVERSTSQNGPWSALAAPATTVNGITRMVDGTAEVGTTYFYRLMVSTPEGREVSLGSLTVQAGVPVKEFELGPVEPNPSRGERIAIRYAVAREANVSLSVHDVQGRSVAELAGGVFRPGRYQAVWSGEVEQGGRAPAGIYFVRFQAPGKSFVKRVAIAR